MRSTRGDGGELTPRSVRQQALHTLHRHRHDRLQLLGEQGYTQFLQQPAERDPGHGGLAAVPALPQPDTRRRYSWAELMKRVFRVDMLVCAHCGRKRKLPAALIDSDVIRKILQHLRLPTDAPRLRPPRPPPQPGLPFD